MRGILLYLFLVFWMIFFNPNSWGYSSNECISCHAEGSKASRLRIRIEEFNSSAHAKELTCSDCHTGVTDKTHTNMKGSGRVDCRKCHEQKQLHGGTGRKIECYLCHTKHHILSPSDSRSSIHRSNLKKTCSRCHPVECGKTRLLSYLPSLRVASHPKQDFSKIYDKGNCIGCHQGRAVHGEKGPVDTKEACYKCHSTIGEKARLFGYIHTEADWRKQPISFIAGVVYVIAVVLFLIFGAFIYRKMTRIEE